VTRPDGGSAPAGGSDANRSRSGKRAAYSQGGQGGAGYCAETGGVSGVSAGRRLRRRIVSRSRRAEFWTLDSVGSFVFGSGGLSMTGSPPDARGRAGSRMECIDGRGLSASLLRSS
jgi:hypothetical protein